MKTFNDLNFEPHAHWNGVEHALLAFDNGYGVSVLTGNDSSGGFSGPYAFNGEFEVAIMKGPSLKELDLCYSTPFTDDVLKYQSLSDVKRILKQVQELEII